MLESVYGMEYPVMSFAVSNEFVKKMNKVCYKLGKQLTPFCLFAADFQKEAGVPDLVKFGGLVNPNITLEEEIVNYRRDILKISGDITSEMRKAIVYQYFMTVSICYLEVEKWKTTSGVKEQTFDKLMCTRNPSVMGAWMGEEPFEMQAKYSSYVQTSLYELGMSTVRYVKLNTSSKGNSITKPRTFPSTDDMRCIPLFMLYAWFEGVKTVLQDNIVQFTFLKDNHTFRKLDTTLSEDIIMKYYTDNLFVNTMLSGIDVDQNQQGGMGLSTKVHRGYVKVPELGASVYDSSGTRSLNLARIIKAEVVQDIDTSYINVSLDSVLSNFVNCLEWLVVNSPDSLYDVYEALLGVKTTSDSGSIVSELSAWADSRISMLSTQFKRHLHDFLIGHPEWFPYYTGVPVENEKSFAYETEMMEI